MRILYCGSGWLPIIDRIALSLPAGTTIARWDRSQPLARCVDDIDVLLPSNAAITAEVIAAAPKLRLVQQPAAGTEGIDKEAAVARGIAVCNAPGTNHVSVAELALFLLLGLARRAPLHRATFDARVIGEPIGFELAGKTLGIVGMGRSGSALAERARALRMTVISLNRGASADEKAAFFGTAHAVSLHCPLTPETRNLVDRTAFAAMRPGALLVNCARGGIVDRGALVEALAANKLGGVGLDVLWDEPGDPAEPLYQDPRVLVLPHVAGSTTEAFERITQIVVENVRRIATGEPLLYRVA